MKTLGFCLVEAGKNLRSNIGLSVASVTTAIVSLLVLGVFLALSFNITHFATIISDQVGVHVFLKQGTPVSDSTSLADQVRGWPHVKSVTYISPDQALSQLKADFGSQGNLFSGIGSSNPLLPALQVQATAPQYVSAIAVRLQGLPNVDSVHYQADVVSRLLSLFSAVRVAGLALGILLAAGALLVIGNAIRTGIYARRREIQIMRLVGATEPFVRWPFVLEGLLLGAVGGIIAFLILDYGYRFIFRAVSSQLPFIPLLPISSMLSQMALVLIGLGVVLGFIGSRFSFRRVRL